MDTEKILERFNDPECKSIYGYMYGRPWVMTPQGKERDEILEIEKNLLQIGQDNDCFIFIWGWPGPYYNVYEFSEYGWTWAFTKEEIQNPEGVIRG